MDREALIARAVDEVAPYTMVHPEGLAFTIAAVLDVVDRELEGALVECGTWMGGASFAMLLVQRYAFGRIVKPVWMFDSFQGLPAASPRDGPAARSWQNDVCGPTYRDNCTAPLNKVAKARDHFGFTDAEAVIVPGWFDDTLPASRAALSAEKIALLRIDCDWYDPVSLCLAELAPAVVDEGQIILDDYYVWDGCARATHDFLSRNDLPWRLRTIGRDEDVGAWMIKSSGRPPD